MILLIKLNTIIVPFLSALYEQRLPYYPWYIHLEVRLSHEGKFDLAILWIPPHF